jgi:adenylosuccinate lyase
MIDRYTLPPMRTIWSVEHKLEVWLRIERLVCEFLSKQGEIPAADLNAINQNVDLNISRMEEIEAQVKHDVIAFLQMVSEQVGPSSRFIHLGLTSSDVLDTSLSFLMTEAADRIMAGLRTLQEVLRTRAYEFKGTIMVGRSHGIHGEPITFGLKLALWHAEIGRNIKRMIEAREGMRYGKISGAMGTFAHLSPEAEAYVCEKLGLKPAPISNQILQRDRHAEYLMTLAVIAATVEKIALEIRHLQRTEVGEAEEYFGRGQKGSSAMPHKRNPVGSENLTGLARIVRSNAMAALEDVALWHERDISHSSVERIIIPDSTCLVDYMLNRITELIRTLIVYPKVMQANLEKTGGIIYSQRILLELAKKGVSREEAYQAVQQASMRANAGEAAFMEGLKSDPIIREKMSASEIEGCFDAGYYVRNIDTLFKRALEG